MTYLDVLKYQERQMNAMLCAPWIGMRSDRDMFKYALSHIREVIWQETKRLLTVPNAT